MISLLKLKNDCIIIYLCFLFFSLIYKQKRMSIMKKLQKIAVYAMVLSVLNACGGGGSDSKEVIIPQPININLASNTTTTNSLNVNSVIAEKLFDIKQIAFPFQIAYKKMWENGYTNTFKFSILNKACSGTVITKVDKAIESKFENISTFAHNQKTDTNYLDCGGLTNQTITEKVIGHYDSNYAFIGSISSINDLSNTYSSFDAPPTWPKTVKIGDTGLLGQYTSYTDNTKTVTLAYNKLSYTVSEDPGSTKNTPSVLFIMQNNISTIKDAANPDIQEITTYRLSLNNSLLDTLRINLHLNNSTEKNELIFIKQ
jgi:hypothetical protein